MVMVAGCLALQLSGTAHLALSTHDICAEHGEAVDVTPPAQTRGADLDLAQPTGMGPMARSGDSPIGESHEHCPLAEDRGGRALVVPPAHVGPAFVAPVSAAGPQARIETPSARARYLLAPKTSPPA
jgi:hypothetical protein